MVPWSLRGTLEAQIAHHFVCSAGRHTRAKVPTAFAHGRLRPQRVQVSLWYILIGYLGFGGLSIYHNDTWTLWGRALQQMVRCANGNLEPHELQFKKSPEPPKPLN